MATRVFHDDFESGGVSAWDAPSFESACDVVTVAADGGGPHAGTYCAKGNWDGTGTFPYANNRTTLVKMDYGSYTSEVFLRLWFRIDNNVDPKNGMKILRFGVNGNGAGGGGQQYYCAVDMTGNDSYELFQFFESMNSVPGPITYTGGANAGDHNWHKLEIYVKHNTPGFTDGIVRSWFDGSLELEDSACTSVTTGESWNGLALVSNWSNNPGWEHDALNNIYFDDVEIFSDSSSGDATTGSMSDASIEATGGGGGSQATKGIGRRLNIGVWKQ